MAEFVSTAWVAERLENSKYVILDSRRPMKYLSGHLKNAVNLPAYKSFDTDLVLLPVEVLAEQLGAAGVDSHHSPILYDSYDGQNSSVIAWILEYLGRDDVSIMDRFYDQWLAEKREVFYKPVEPTLRIFSTRVQPSVRATAEDILANPATKLIDFRSREEFTGERDLDNRPGHIPGAAHIFWLDLVTPEGFLASKDRLQQLFSGVGVKPGDRVISYCRTGLRAAVGYLALQQLGNSVQLYDGSYHDWVKCNLSVEV